MSEEPKSIWKKSWTGWRSLLLGWLGLMVATLIIFVTFMRATGTRITKDEIRFIFAGEACATFAVIFVLFIRWVFCWRNFRRFLFGLACFATLVALFYAEEDWRGRHAWEKFTSEWEAKGEKFDYASVIPAPVPDDQNFALTPVVASSYLTYFDKTGHEVRPRNTNVIDRLSMLGWRDNRWATMPESDGWQASKEIDLKAWQEYFRSPPPKDWIETNSFPVSPEPQTPAADVLLALSKYDSDIEEIRQASRLSYSRFPLTYETRAAFSIILPHLAALKSCAKAVELRSLAELQTGQTEPACDDAQLDLRLTGALRAEPILISQLVRIAMLESALQPVWEGLAGRRWSDAQLVALDAELAKMDFLADYKIPLRGELGFQGNLMDYLRHHPERVPDLSGSFDDDRNKTPITAKLAWRLIPSGWFYQNQMRSSHVMVEFDMPAIDVNQRTASPEMVRRAAEALNADVRHLGPYNYLEAMFAPSLGGTVKKFAFAQVSVDLARTAIALERYRLAHGEFPESLDVLAPQFIAQVPHDVIGGQPLRYRRTSDGQFVLYSIGWNEKDDGGIVVLKKGDARDESPHEDADQGDWVWQYPAK